MVYEPVDKFGCLCYTIPQYGIFGGTRMPIYEYSCAACGERFELFVRSASQQNAPTCPKCGSPKVQKAVSLFGVGGAAGGSKAGAPSCGPGPV